MKRLGILLSGRGSNFEAIADNVAAGSIDADIAVVISNRPEARGLEAARAARAQRRVHPFRRDSTAKPTTAWWSRNCGSTRWTWSAWRVSCGC